MKLRISLIGLLVTIFCSGVSAQSLGWFGPGDTVKIPLILSDSSANPVPVDSAADSVLIRIWRSGATGSTDTVYFHRGLLDASTNTLLRSNPAFTFAGRAIQTFMFFETAYTLTRSSTSSGMYTMMIVTWDASLGLWKPPTLETFGYAYWNATTSTYAGLLDTLLRAARFLLVNVSPDTTAAGYIKTDAYSVGGTAQTARDLGASVLLSSGTGTGQVSLSSGLVALQADQAVNATKIASQTASASGTVTFPAATLASTTNITAASGVTLAQTGLNADSGWNSTKQRVLQTLDTNNTTNPGYLLVDVKKVNGTDQTARDIGGSVLLSNGTGAGQISLSSGLVALQPDQAVNATKIGGTTQTARDLGASVLLSSGTGTGQISLTSGTVTLAPGQFTKIGDTTTWLFAEHDTTGHAGSWTGGSNWFNRAVYAAVRQFIVDSCATLQEAADTTAYTVHDEDTTRHQAALNTATKMAYHYAQAGGGGVTAQQVWEYGTRTLTSGGGTCPDSAMIYAVVYAAVGDFLADSGATMQDLNTAIYTQIGAFLADSGATMQDLIDSLGRDSTWAALATASIQAKVWKALWASFDDDATWIGARLVATGDSATAALDSLQNTATLAEVAAFLDDSLRIYFPELNLVRNGGFEQQAVANSWTVNNGTPVLVKVTPTSTGGTGRYYLDNSADSVHLSQSLILDTGLYYLSVSTLGGASYSLTVKFLSGASQALDSLQMQNTSAATAGRLVQVTTAGTYTLQVRYTGTTTNGFDNVRLFALTVGATGGDGVWTTPEKDSVLDVLDDANTLLKGRLAEVMDSLTSLQDSLQAVMDSLNAAPTVSELTDSIEARLVYLRDSVDAILDSLQLYDTRIDSLTAALADANSKLKGKLEANLDVQVSSRSTFDPTTDPVIVAMSHFNDSLDNDTDLVTYLRLAAAGGAGSEVWLRDEVDSIIARAVAIRDSVHAIHLAVEAIAPGVADEVWLRPEVDTLLARSIAIRDSVHAVHLGLASVDCTGGSGCGDSLGYTRTIVVIDTSAVPDVVVNGIEVFFNNTAQSADPYKVTTRGLGRAALGLNAGTWVRLHSDSRYLPKTDTFTVAGAGTDTMRLCQAELLDSDTLTTTVLFHIKKPDGSANDSAIINIELVPVPKDSLLRVGGTVLGASYAQMLFRTATDGRAYIHLYPNSLVVNDSCYRVTVRSRASDRILETFRFTVPVADTTVNIANLTRWK